MKLRLLASVLAVSATLTHMPAQAAGAYSMGRDTAPRINIYQDSYSYAGIDMMNWNFNNSDNTIKGSDRGTRFTFGQRFDEFVSAEVQFGLGGNDKAATGGPVKMKHTLGLFIRGMLPMNRLQLKGLVGYTASQFDIAAVGESYSSVSFGLGAELNVWRDVYANVDYIKYVSTSNFDMDSVNVGVGFRF